MVFLKAPPSGGPLFLSIFKYKNPYPRDFFERIRSIRAYGDTRCGLRRTLLLSFSWLLPFLLPAMTPTLEQDFTLFALYHCRVNAIWNLTCMSIAYQCLNHYIENDSQYFKQVFKFLVHLFHTHAFQSHWRRMTAWFSWFQSHCGSC